MSEPRPSDGTDSKTETETEDDGVLVPPPEERRWLLDQLAAMVKRFGPDRLLVGPMPWPNEEWFPDKWAGGEPSMRRLIRRLMMYAGLPDDPVEVTIEDDGQGGGGVAGGGTYASVWFVGRKGGVMRFAALATSLRSPLVVVPAAARAVAEAFLRVGGIAVKDDGAGQRLVDIAGAYLGFGVLTVDAAIRHLTGAQTGFRSTRSRSRLGVLAPQSLAFVFAAATVARQCNDAEAKRIGRSMQPNPRAFFNAARSLLQERQPPLPDALGLPPRDEWPAPPDYDELREPFDDDEEDEAPEERRDQDKGVVGMNEGKPVFRVERSKALRLAKMLAMPTVMLGMVAGRMNMGIDIPMWQIGIAAAGLGILGLGVGRLLPDSRCSEPKCGVALRKDDEVCPRCGGTVRGVIAHPKERLAAEEALAKKDEASEASE